MPSSLCFARDSAGRWRHPARPHRIRADVDVQEVPLFGEGGAWLCAAIVDRPTFGGNIIETGSDSYRLAQTRTRQHGTSSS